MKPHRCARKGCTGTTLRRFCSARCASKAGWNAPNGRGRQQHVPRAQVKPTSWWTDNPSTFYAEARARFPLVDAVGDRSKVFTHGTESAGFNSRAKAARERRRV
jgi:hypothetical protein